MQLQQQKREREGEGDLVPDCMGTAPTRRGMRAAQFGHVWDQDT